MSSRVAGAAPALLETLKFLIKNSATGGHLEEMESMGAESPKDEIHDPCLVNLDVSKNNGTPKWMVYNGKPY